jgi:hypothetical protein
MTENYKKDFVPYEQALALKELGFDEPCFSYYKNDQLSEIEEVINSKMRNVNNEIDDYISAPLYQQAFRWFREKYSIQSTIDPTKDQHRFELGFNYWIWNTKTGEEWFTEPKNRPSGDYVFDSYEEAELECLNKLIEIVKQQTHATTN